MNKLSKFYYINLEKRPNRNQNVIDECTKHNVDFNIIKRFNAIDGTTYKFSDEELKMFDKVDYKNRDFKYKIMGNQLSHFYILKEMIENNYEYIIIVQDDIKLKNNFIDYINNIINNLPDDAEIINFAFHKYAAYAHFVPWNLDNPEIEDNKYLIKQKKNDYVCLLNNTINPCSLGYIVTLQGAKNFINYINKVGFLRATDWNYNDYLLSKNIFYGSNIVLATGNTDFKSDIFN